MKEQLHINSLTHIEKLDMFIDKLKTMKNNPNVNNDSKLKKGMELMVMMHDYKKFFSVIQESEGFSENHPYIKKLKNLYYETEGNNKCYKNKLFNKDIELKKDTENMIDCVNVKFYMIKLFQASNKRIFKIGSKLLDLIDITDYNNDVSYIKTPYDCIYMQFPSNFGQKRSWGHTNHAINVEGVYISIKEGMMRYVLVPKYKLDLENLSNSRMILTECLPSLLSLEKKITIKEIINNYKKTNESFTCNDEYILTTIIKLLMHITSINVDTEKVTPNLNILTKKKKILKKGKTTLPYEYVGGDIIINNNNNFAKSLPGGNGRQIQTKFMVRGHYRGFWMNLNDNIPNHQIVEIKDDKMLVIKWVEPFWKGKEFSEVVLRNYKVV